MGLNHLGQNTDRTPVELTWPCATCGHAAEYHRLDAARPDCALEGCACRWYKKAPAMRAADAVALARKAAE